MLPQRMVSHYNFLALGTTISSVWRRVIGIIERSNKSWVSNFNSHVSHEVLERSSGIEWEMIKVHCIGMTSLIHQSSYRWISSEFVWIQNSTCLMVEVSSASDFLGWMFRLIPSSVNLEPLIRLNITQYKINSACTCHEWPAVARW